MEAKDSAQAEVRAGKLPERPLPNTYWVEPGRLLAGEYPGAKQPRDAEVRLKCLLDAGVNCFIDLTQRDEMPAYEPLLARLDPDAKYHRFGIIDHGLPASPGVIADALDCIDQALASGRNVYVHCRAGVGRTGTMLGCYFIRRGLRTEAAFDRLAEAWQQSERSRFIPQIPETDEQASYVRAWFESRIVSRTGTASRVEGALLGLAVAEAQATMTAGEWGSDTAMTLLLAESLLACEGLDLDDNLRRFQRWLQEGRVQGTQLQVPVPAVVKRSVASWAWSRKPYAGSHDPANLEPLSLARTTAVAMYFRTDPGAAIEAAAEASRTTNQSPVVLDACRYFAALLLEVLSGVPKPQMLMLVSNGVGAALRSRTLKPEVQSLLNKAWQDAASPPAGDTVVAALSQAISAFARTADFREGLALLLRSSGKTATAAAIYGALAGAYYTSRGLPADLRSALAEASLLEGTAAAMADVFPGEP